MSQDLDILTLGLPEAWNMFKILNNHNNEYKSARFGIIIKFDINDYLKGRVLTKPKTGKALIRGVSHSLEDFETELEEREKVIKQWLLNNYVEDELTAPRGTI